MRPASARIGVVALVIALLAACSSMFDAAGTHVPAASNIKGPRELPYYDVAWAKALTLESMNARIVSRDAVDGIDILALEYDAFDQPIAAADGVKVVRWRQRGTLILPPAPLPLGKAVTVNVHSDDAGDRNQPHSFVNMGLDIARAFHLPVLIHGWMPDVLTAADGKGVHDTQVLALSRLLAARVEDADKLPMDGRFMFNGNPLAKADMVSLTLAQRLIKRERSRDITEFASLGISKEGAAHWILGALDDRVTVLGPGGYYVHDSKVAYDRYGKDTNWRFPWVGGERPEYDGLRQLFSTFWRVLDWVNTTDAGQLVARTTMDPARWYQDIRARHVVVFGDLGFMPGQHDGPWPFWAENQPLATFTHPSWRYVRVFDGSGVFMDANGIGEMGLSMLPQLADLLVNDAVMPGTPIVEATAIGERQVAITATAAVTPGLPHDALLIYAVSPERGLRDRERWKIVPMAETGPGTWKLALPAIPDSHGLTYMVEVRERATTGELSYWRSASSLPVERFPVPEFDVPGPRWKD